MIRISAPRFKSNLCNGNYFSEECGRIAHKKTAQNDLTDTQSRKRQRPVKNHKTPIKIGG